MNEENNYFYNFRIDSLNKQTTSIRAQHNYSHTQNNALEELWKNSSKSSKITRYTEQLEAQHRFTTLWEFAVETCEHALRKPLYPEDSR